jgi:hypothetical protein
MAKLFTKEDKYHIHKVLGLLCLVNYVYRIALAFSGCPGDHMHVFWLFAHGGLSVTGLIFHVPANRISKRPLIYREFRAHSILFALRSVAVLALMRLFPGVSWLRVAAVIATIVGADVATALYKPDNTTMRGMPYPDGTPDLVKYTMNKFYSVSQVLATMNTLFTTNPDVPVLVMFPIQLAALLMTLVRKGYLGVFGWHVLYSAALLTNYVHAVMFCSATGSWNYIRLATMFCILRFDLNINKYVLWLAICGFAIAA